MKKINHLLVAIMFSDILQQNFSYFDITARFRNQFKEFFENIDPIQPIPANQMIQGNLPPEIPRYILQTNDDKVNFSFSSIRFDLHFNNEEITIEEVKHYVKSIEECLKDFRMPHYRIGIVVEGSIDTGNDLDKFIDKYLNVEAMPEATELQLSYRNILSEGGYNYNEWIRYFIFKDNPIINYLLDINYINEITNFNLLSANNDNIIRRVGDFIDS